MKKKKADSNFKIVASGTGAGRNGFIIEEYKIVKSENGDIVKYYVYNIEPQKSLEGEHLFNTYGQKIYNKLTDYDEYLVDE